MKKRCVNFDFESNFLHLIAYEDIKNYIETYFGNLLNNKNNSPVMILQDEKLGTYYKVSYYLFNDYDIKPVNEFIYIGTYGPLFVADDELFYLPSNHIESKTWLDLVMKKLEDNQQKSEYLKKYSLAHKQSNKSYQKHLKKLAKQIVYNDYESDFE